MASAALQTYRDKRRFDQTPEPAEGGTANERARAFVVQKHWARRLHYDFRLELEGTMKSWAVPKGPSLDPSERRMAQPTEDHPIAYNRFEGTIPAGNYGAGEVVIWDKGTWHPLEDPHEGWRAGKLKFELRGHKLRGAWMLVRMKGRDEDTRHGREPPWLLIKERDREARPATEYSITDELPDSVAFLAEVPSSAAPSAPPPSTGTAASASAPTDGPPSGAVPAPLPAKLAPQLAVLSDASPDDAALGWIHEVKFDGYRMLARVESGQPRLYTRNGLDWTVRMPELRDALVAMDLPDGWYDGEVIVPGADTPTDFQALQGAFDTARTRDIVFYLFDLPYCAGHDLRAVALEQRREVLARIVNRKPQPQVRFSEVFDAPASQVVASACAIGLEGVIAKRLGSAYRDGQRSSDWLKLKCGRRQEFVIAGWTEPQGSRTGFGALLLGVHDDSGILRYAGSVGTGFNQRTLAQLRKKLDALAARTSPYPAGTKVAGKPHWVRPQLVAEIAFTEWTRDGRVRHAVFHGLRDDKPARAITREDGAAPAQAATATARTTRAAAPQAASKAPPATALPIRISNPDRLVDAQSEATKRELAQYYHQVGELMMPHLRERPIAMVRAPNGIEGELFFQKHLERYKMAGIEEQDPALDPGHKRYLCVAEPLGVVSAAQMNVIEFHTWNAVTPSFDRPDRMTFDLDPGDGVGWPQMQEAATLVRALLEEMALPAFLKTSGGKGLHLIVPLQPSFGWDTVKDFSQAIVQHLARALPERFVAKSGPRNRVGRIFIDYLRNGYGATTICAWSARARPGLGISVPVKWDELPRLTGGAHWHLRNVHGRLETGNDPWWDYEHSRATLQAAMERIGFEAHEGALA